MLIFLSRGILDVVSTVICYDTLSKMKRSPVEPDAHRSFLSPPDTLRLPGWVIIGLILCNLTPACFTTAKAKGKVMT